MKLIRAFKAFFNAFKDEKEAPAAVQKSEQPAPDIAHLRLLSILQKEGRLLDFLQEDIANYSDAQVGMAVRTIHAKCRESIEEFVTLRPVFTEDEGEKVTVPQGYDPSAIKVIGRVRGDPPYKGILRHKGWKAHKQSLPKQIAKGDLSIVCPAEVEVK